MRRAGVSGQLSVWWGLQLTQFGEPSVRRGGIRGVRTRPREQAGGAREGLGYKRAAEAGAPSGRTGCLERQRGAAGGRPQSGSSRVGRVKAKAKEGDIGSILGTLPPPSKCSRGHRPHICIPMGVRTDPPALGKWPLVPGGPDFTFCGFHVLFSMRLAGGAR